jgi:hypothetical protein
MRRVLEILKERLAKFGLTPPEKTSLVEFGRLLAVARQQRGRRRPGTFAFLRFTRYRRWTRDGRFIMKRKSKRLCKLNALREDAWRHTHSPLTEQHRRLSRPHVRLRTRPVSQYAGSEGCAGLAGAEPHA